MKKLTAIWVALAMSVSACTSDAAESEIGTTISDLATQAQALANDGDIDPQLANAIQVVSQNATTVGLAATGGEVSDEDLDSLVRALDDFESQFETARETLDPDVQAQLDSLESDLRDAVDQLDG